MGKQGNVAPSSINRNKPGSTMDLVAKISMGETKTFSVQKDKKYSAPAAEDLIPEDEYVLKPDSKN